MISHRPHSGHTPHWTPNGNEAVPYWVYTDRNIYEKELDRFFYHGHWNFVGFEAELPELGDFKRVNIGEVSVVAVRCAADEIVVVENACAHRGVALCQKRHGKIKDFVCPYHQWRYDLKGNLKAVPFLHGVKLGEERHGGMPADFKMSEHGLKRARVARRGGLIFATFDENAPSFENYLGSSILPYFDRIFSGKTLKILGYTRQRVQSNWKLMQENVKDPYHAGLLHTWFVNFGLWRADNPSALIQSESGCNAVMISSRKKTGGAGEVTENISSFKSSMVLNDDRVLDVQKEDWWGEPTVTIITLFPSVVIQQQVNGLAIRLIQPHGPSQFDYVWTHFGFADDTPELSERRLRQANLFGPAGFVSADDGEIVECAQRSFLQHPDHNVTNLLGGTGSEIHTPHMVSETLLRGMYKYWRTVMGV